MKTLSDSLECFPKSIINEEYTPCMTFEADACDYMRRDNLHSQARNNKRITRKCHKRIKLSSINIYKEKISDYRY